MTWSSLAIAACIGSIQKFLHFLLVLHALLKDEPAPVDGPDPSEQVDGREHLSDAQNELSL